MKVAIGLGSNLGDRLGHLREAVANLRSVLDDGEVSPLYESDPVGGPRDQDRYLNAVMVGHTSLSPQDLLAVLNDLEERAGRLRVERWGARTLDLDLVTTDGPAVASPDLTVPHPRAAERPFVLAPLAEVWDDAPVGGTTATEAQATVAGIPMMRWDGDWVTDRPHLGPRARRWVMGQLALFAVYLLSLLVTPPDLGSAMGWSLGSPLVVGGLVLGAWATVTLGPELSPLPQPRPGAQLVERGPYALVRHPIYGAILLVFAGLAIVVGAFGALMITIGIGAFFWRKSELEERALGVLVPGYLDYRRRVTKRLIPWVV